MKNTCWIEIKKESGNYRASIRYIHKITGVIATSWVGALSSSPEGALANLRYQKPEEFMAIFPRAHEAPAEPEPEIPPVGSDEFLETFEKLAKKIEFNDLLEQAMRYLRKGLKA